MRWFKKRATPFDDHFGIHIETPPDPGSDQTMFFTVPDWYYAHLFYLEFLFDQAIMADPIARSIVFRTTRGGNMLTQWLLAFSPKVNTDFRVRQWIGAPRTFTALTLPQIEQGPLPPNLYLYPGDVVVIEQLPWHIGDRIKDFSLTFRIWEV